MKTKAKSVVVNHITIEQNIGNYSSYEDATVEKDTTGNSDVFIVKGKKIKFLDSDTYQTHEVTDLYPAEKVYSIEMKHE